MVTGFRSSGWIALTARGFSTSSLISRPPTASPKPLLAGTSAETTERSQSRIGQIVPDSSLQNANHLAEPIEPLGDFHDRDGREGKRRGVPCRSQSGLPR